MSAMRWDAERFGTSERRDHVPKDLGVTNWVQPVSRDDLDLTTDIRGEASLHREEVHRVHTEPYVGDEVEIASGSVFATSDRAEDCDMKEAAGLEFFGAGSKHQQGAVKQATIRRASRSVLRKSLHCLQHTGRPMDRPSCTAHRGRNGAGRRPACFALAGSQCQVCTQGRMARDLQKAGRKLVRGS